MGYSTAWRSQWRILKQHICIWQFFRILLYSTGYTICSPWVLSCLWAILTDRYIGTALGGYLWKSNATGMNHLLLHSHILDFHTISAFYWSQEKTCASICTWRAVSVSLFSPPTCTHTYSSYLPLPPADLGGVHRYEKCGCLFLPCPVSFARGLAQAGAWAGHKSTGTTVSPIWSFSLQAVILPPYNLPPKATDWIWTFLPRDLLAAHPICTSKSIKCLYVMFCIFNQCCYLTVNKYLKHIQ